MTRIIVNSCIRVHSVPLLSAVHRDLDMAMCIELATQKGWRRYAFPRFISFILRYLSQTERYSHVLWLI